MAWLRLPFPPSSNLQPTALPDQSRMGCYSIRGSDHRASSASGSSGSSCAGDAEEVEWEVRPCGMLVQKRVLAPPTAAAAAGCTGTTGGSVWKKKKSKQVIRVRVAYGGRRYDVAVHYQATFGELKKLLSLDTGLRPADQRLAFKGKERRDGEYLDLCGVKEGAKLVLEEDPCSKERRYTEMQKAAREQTIQRAVGDVAMEVERLADQVACIHQSVSRGSKVAEAQITTLIEMLMRHAIRLDAIPAEDQRDHPDPSSSLASQKHLQAKRIHKCVETLDLLLLSNARINTNNQRQQSNNTRWEATLQPRRTTTTYTTHWEFFD